MNYCPIVNEQQALASIQARCADLKAEQQDRALCGVCIDPNAPVAAASLARGGWNALAERPTCPRPIVIGDVPVEATSAPLPEIALPVAQITAPPVAPTPMAPLQTVAVPKEEVSVLRQKGYSALPKFRGRNLGLLENAIPSRVANRINSV